MLVSKTLWMSRLVYYATVTKSETWHVVFCGRIEGTDGVSKNLEFLLLSQSCSVILYVSEIVQSTVTSPKKITVIRYLSGCIVNYDICKTVHQILKTPVAEYIRLITWITQIAGSFLPLAICSVEKP
jgi:hypothetical protein